MQFEIGYDAGAFHSQIMSKILLQDGDINYRQNISKGFHSLEENMIISDQYAYLGSLLERQDKISMAHGVEVRVPFCNHKLFEVMNALEFKDKTTPVPKALLKKILSKSYPDDFVYRRKNGFRLPLHEWICDQSKLGRYLDYLSDDTFKNRELFDYDEVQKAIQKHSSGTANYGNELFALITFEIWAREFGV